MSDESPAMKTLISYAIIGQLFRNLHSPAIKQGKINTPGPSPEQIKAEARANLKKTLHEMRMKR